MNEREKKLLVGLLAVAAIGVTAKYLYPGVVKPLLNYGRELERAQETLESLEAKHDVLQTGLKARYVEFVSRNGDTDPQEVQYRLSERIDQQLRDARLRESDIKQKGISYDRKTNVATLAVSFSAVGKFADCVKFIEAVYRFPYVLRFRTLKLTPTPARQKADHDEVTLDAEIEAIVLPQEGTFGRVTKAQPDTHDRLASADRQALLDWKPFTPYFEPPAPRATPKPTPRPTPGPQPGPSLPTGPPSSQDAEETVLNMVLCYGQLPSADSALAVDEVRLKNTEDDTTRYVAVGGSLDEGTLVLVNAFGAVVHKRTEDEDFGYWVYPIGERLSDNMPLEDAGEWPEIQYAMKQFLEAAEERLRTEDGAAVDADFVGPPSPEGFVEGPPQVMEDQPALEDDLLGPPAPELTMPDSPDPAARDAKLLPVEPAEAKASVKRPAHARPVKSTRPTDRGRVKENAPNGDSEPATARTANSAAPRKSRPGMSRRAVRKRPDQPMPDEDRDATERERLDE